MEQTVLDRESLEALREILEGEFLDLIQAFLTDAPKRIEAMNQAWQAGDVSALEHASHTLKGSSANIGAPKLAELCGILCNQCRQDQLSDPEAQLAAIEAALAELKLELEAYL